MVSRFRQIQKLLGFVILLLAVVILSLSCNPPIASNKNKKNFFRHTVEKAEFYLGDKEKYEFSDLLFSSDGEDRLLVLYKKKLRSEKKGLGIFIRFSEDGGTKFGEEYGFGKLLGEEKGYEADEFIFLERGVAVLAGRNGNIFYSRFEKDIGDWRNPVQINNEQGSVIGNARLIQKNENDAYCVWRGRRRGISLVYFSASHDGGKTWSSDKPIEDDFRRDRQWSPQLIFGADGRLLLFWQDSRDRKTLLDIRYSYSDDQGKTWIPSQKINDDDQAVWQVDPTIVSDGENIYIAFSDFREKGEDGDNDWNIYFSRSHDNGRTWEKNKRLNDIKRGRDRVPTLVINKKGSLFCFWRTTRDTLFGQIALSYSDDKGDSWSPSITLTNRDKMVFAAEIKASFISLDRLLVGWIDESETKKRRVFSFLKQSVEPIKQKVSKDKSDDITPLAFNDGKILFTDDFSGVAEKKWTPDGSFWKVVDGTYMGVNPRPGKQFFSFAKFAEPKRYVMRGRFRFDAVAHYSSNLSFRTNETGLRRYVVTNHFRMGSWLTVKNDDLPSRHGFVVGKPLAQKSFPFRQNRWYKFALVVTPEQVDYYVDGRLMLSYKERLRLQHGKIGIGGFSNAPTYFDDITISELE